MADEMMRTGEFGNLDGEIPRAALVKVSGAGQIDRGMLRGERVALTLIGEVTGVAFKKVDGVLTRIHTVKVDEVGEPTDSLADAVMDFLEGVGDARAGRAKLTFEVGDSAGEEE